jgi:hypothetical protein
MPQGIRREPATVQMGYIDSQRDLIPDFHRASEPGLTACAAIAVRTSAPSRRAPPPTRQLGRGARMLRLGDGRTPTSTS